MLSEYRDYLVNVRNNLIQSGIEYPINSMDTYEELFYEAVNLQQVLWYFSVMAVGDDSQELGIPGYFIDLTGYYRDKMRRKFYEEFRDTVDDYKRISTTAILLRGDEVAQAGDTGSVEEQEGDDVFEVEEEGNEIVEEVHGTFVDDLKVTGGEPVVAEYTPTPKGMGNGMDFFRSLASKAPETIDVVGSEDDGAEEVHGTFVEDLGVSNVKDSGSADKDGDISSNNEVHGTFIEDMLGGVGTSAEDDIHGTYIEDLGNSAIREVPVVGEIHGTFVEDIGISNEGTCISSGGVVNYNKDSDGAVVRGTFIDDIVIGSSNEKKPEKVEVKPVERPVVKHQEKVRTSGDLSDVLQDVTNNLLTKGKRALVEEQMKLMKG